MIKCSNCGIEINDWKAMSEYNTYGGICKDCYDKIHNISDYKFRQVGLKRHPELYVEKETMVKPVFDTVEKEVAMWETAEQIDAMLRKFSIEQSFFIWHYVNALRGMDTLEELKWMEWLKFRAYYARIKNIDEEIKESDTQQ